MRKISKGEFIPVHSWGRGMFVRFGPNDYGRLMVGGLSPQINRELEAEYQDMLKQEDAPDEP